jgi:hypothetical protein
LGGVILFHTKILALARVNRVLGTVTRVAPGQHLAMAGYEGPASGV